MKLLETEIMSEATEREADTGQRVPHDIVASSLAEMSEGMEREAFERWASDGGEWPKAVERSGDGYRLMQTQQLWTAWKARAALQCPCRGIAHHGCDYLAPCGSICNKCGQHV